VDLLYVFPVIVFFSIHTLSFMKLMFFMGYGVSGYFAVGDTVFGAFGVYMGGLTCEIWI